MQSVPQSLFPAIYRNINARALQILQLLLLLLLLSSSLTPHCHLPFPLLPKDNFYCSHLLFAVHVDLLNQRCLCLAWAVISLRLY